MKKILIILIKSTLVMLSLNAHSYEVNTHQAITGYAIALTDFYQGPWVQWQYFKKMGIDTSQYYNNADGQPLSVTDLLKYGSKYEDLYWKGRPFNHFFDPTAPNSDQALKAFCTPFTCEVRQDLNSTTTNDYPSFKSPDWALEDNQSVDNTAIQTGKYKGFCLTWFTTSCAQNFSWNDARSYFFLALTSPIQADRNTNTGLMFQSLGHIVHHIQDMGQPQHTRNDPHDPITSALNIIGSWHHASLYESWIEEYIPSLSLSKYNPVYSSNNTSTFSTPRQFWTNNGKGLADFSNSNFYTEGTNVGNNNYALPVISPTSNPLAITVAEMCNSNAVAIASPAICGYAQYYNSVMTFLSTDVTDAQNGQPYKNNYATTNSIFNSDLTAGVCKNISTCKPIYTLNSINFNSAQQLLLPRAVGYSAGLLNFFFRGNIGVIPDPNTSGNIIIQNQGPDNLTGTFAVYWQDSSGNRSQVQTGWSQTMTIQSNASSASLSTTTLKANTPYTLVFNGTMGAEVPTSDISSIGAVTASNFTLNKPSTPDAINIYETTGSTGSGVVTFNTIPSNEPRYQWSCSLYYWGDRTKLCSNYGSYVYGTKIVLTAYPNYDSTYQGWTGSDAAKCQEGTNQTTCTFIWDGSAVNISATFNALNLYVGTWTAADGSTFTIAADGSFSTNNAALLPSQITYTVILPDQLPVTNTLSLAPANSTLSFQHTTNLYAINFPYKFNGDSTTVQAQLTLLDSYAAPNLAMSVNSLSCMQLKQLNISGYIIDNVTPNNLKDTCDTIPPNSPYCSGNGSKSCVIFTKGVDHLSFVQ